MNTVKKFRIYIDTSVVGGFFDEKFEVETQAFFKRLENKEVIFVISELVEQELKDAPQQVKELLNNYDKNYIEYVKMTTEAERLADCYVSEKVVGATSLKDCQHIALATVNNVDILASWNFKHIVNINRIKGYNGVNLKNGYQTLEIRNPKELLDYEND